MTTDPSEIKVHPGGPPPTLGVVPALTAALYGPEVAKKLQARREEEQAKQIEQENELKKAKHRKQSLEIRAMYLAFLVKQILMILLIMGGVLILAAGAAGVAFVWGFVLGEL